MCIASSVVAAILLCLLLGYLLAVLAAAFERYRTTRGIFALCRYLSFTYSLSHHALSREVAWGALAQSNDWFGAGLSASSAASSLACCRCMGFHLGVVGTDCSTVEYGYQTQVATSWWIGYDDNIFIRLLFLCGFNDGNAPSSPSVLLRVEGLSKSTSFTQPHVLA